jgi:hypothetical protein
MISSKKEACIKQFWKYNIHPITGFIGSSKSTKVGGSGFIKTKTVPKSNSNQFKNVNWY